MFDDFILYFGHRGRAMPAAPSWPRLFGGILHFNINANGIQTTGRIGLKGAGA